MNLLSFNPETILTVAQMDHSDCDCLLIVVLTHGEIVPLTDRRGKNFTTILSHDLFSYLYAGMSLEYTFFIIIGHLIDYNILNEFE